MRRPVALAVVVLAATLLLGAVPATAQSPDVMNYQVMLTDDLDQPLADQSVELVFRLYELESGGAHGWTETHNTATNSIGVVSVILGSVTPIPLEQFPGLLWLEIEADGEVLSPRRRLTSAPYSFHANNSSTLGGIPPSDYTTDAELSASGTINNPSNPVDWTMLKSVPAGFADGTDDTAGGGISGGGTAGYVPKFVAGTMIENSNIYETSGRVSMGTTTSDAKLRVENAFPLPGLIVENTSSSQGFNLVELSRTGPMSNTDGFLQITAPVGAADFSYIHCWQLTSGGARTPFMVSAAGDISSTGSIDVASGDPKAIYVTTDFESDDTIAIEGRFFGPYDGTGVRGEANQFDYFGYGGQFQGGYVGAKGYVEPIGGYSYYGLYGACEGGTGTNNGVLGMATGSGENYGIRGYASGGSTNWAGYFEGDVNVTGTFYNPASALLIDHPLDPVERYLRQPAVHSSEMKNVYDGVLVLDSTGEAWVELPDWFEALNESFRYQLTAIGAPGPNLHVAERISGNRFMIAGGEPGMEVSWQVTGVRHDPVAERYAIQVEERKSDSDRGKYLRPDAYGAPEEMRIGFREGKERGQ
jgi:hypothetical protein